MYKEFADLCELKRVTPYKVAKECGFSGVSLSDWKSGKSTPNADKLIKIARYLGTTVEYLVTGETSDPLPSVILSEEEEGLLAAYRSLNDTGKNKAAEYIRDLSENERYVNDSTDALKKRDSA